jgi:hypothetical protein
MACLLIRIDPTRCRCVSAVAGQQGIGVRSIATYLLGSKELLRLLICRLVGHRVVVVRFASLLGRVRSPHAGARRHHARSRRRRIAVHIGDSDGRGCGRGRDRRRGALQQKSRARTNSKRGSGRTGHIARPKVGPKGAALTFLHSPSTPRLHKRKTDKCMQSISLVNLLGMFPSVE